MPVQSTYNMLVPLEGHPEVRVLFNMLGGMLDVIDQKVASALEKLGPPPRSVYLPSAGRRTQPPAPQETPALGLPEPVCNYLDARGYLFATAEEEYVRSQLLYEEMMRVHRDSARQPFVVIPTYHCNLKCPYCWQRLHHMDSDVMSEQTVKHLFATAPSFFKKDQDPKRVDCVIFGGEPLQDMAPLRERVLQILELSREAGYSTKIITNGVGLAASVPHLKGKVDCIQVTIDGPPQIHAKRRPMPGNGDSFTPMAEGMDLAIQAGLRINVRVNVDETNLQHLPELGDDARKRGWFDTQLVRFHLAPVKHHNPDKARLTEEALLARLLEMVAADERMKGYDLSGFSGVKYFAGFKKTGLFPLQRFFNCEAQINFFSFDLNGDVYGCWDASGIRHLAVGRFDPEPQLFPGKIAQWRHRTSLDIGGCHGCTVSPLCGGGCQFQTLEHHGVFLDKVCDSMKGGLIQSIQRNAEWILDRARTGDHAVGLVTSQSVTRPRAGAMGLLDDDRNSDLIAACG